MYLTFLDSELNPFLPQYIKDELLQRAVLQKAVLIASNAVVIIFLIFFKRNRFLEK
ncbi:hypothetical protein [Flavivirga rizhaonensis]|uniref:hypothetical protein n=1 Tax=Flavivirga rizhaonensis TaxID=2559571 RepID=UPI001B865C13|nr:hypothetical protein [Flavivirga rizhaonensis]